MYLATVDRATVKPSLNNRRSLDVRGVVAEVVLTNSRSASLNGDESRPLYCFT
jgi:hypothetical protein